MREYLAKRSNRPALVGLILACSETIGDLNLVQRQRLMRIMGFFYVSDDQARVAQLEDARKRHAEQHALENG